MDSKITTEMILNTISKCNVVSDALALNVDTSLLEQEVDSLDMASILLQIDEQYEIEIPDDIIDELDTVTKITKYINEHR